MPARPQSSRLSKRRGSTRKFARSPITLPQLSTMLDRATRGVPGDFLDPPGTQLNDLYLIIHEVEGLPPGAYVFHRDRGVLESLKQGNFRARCRLPRPWSRSCPPTRRRGHLFPRRPAPHFCSASATAAIRAVQLEAGNSRRQSSISRRTPSVWVPRASPFRRRRHPLLFSPRRRPKAPIFLVALGHSAKHKP